MYLLAALAAYLTTSIDYANTFAPVKDEALGAVTGVLAPILVVFAVILGVRLGLKFFRTVTGR